MRSALAPSASVPLQCARGTFLLHLSHPFLHEAVVLGAFFLAACRGPVPSTAPVCADCNVVLVSIDTLRADHVGAYGYDVPTTPVLDALAKRGVLFENAIAQSSWTRPAHMSIFTGLFPVEHGYVSLADRLPLDAKTPTLASVLRSRGYTTAGFTGGVNVAAEYGFDVGFDVYRSNGKSFRDNFEDARLWLHDNASQRFFLFLHGYDAHTQYRSDPVDREAVGLVRRPPRRSFRKACRSARGRERIVPYIAEYDAAVHRADRYLGKIVAELAALGLSERTILVVVSDHGEEFLEHGRCFHLTTLHREVLHVPFVVVAPGLPARRVRETVPASASVAPTILDLLGFAGALPGPSLREAMLGGAVPDVEVVSETERNPANGGEGHLVALSTDDEKFIEWTTEDRRTYYRVDRDPMELGPLRDEARERSLDGRLSPWRKQKKSAPSRRPAKAAPAASASGGTSSPLPSVSGGAQPPSAAASPDPEQLQREQELRSLGYLE